MHRKSYLFALTGTLLAFAASMMLTAVARAGSPNRPNILWIMSDDHAAQAVGAYGGRLASLNPTPNIDRLAKEGIRFTNVFCGNSICTPSRATLLTGQHSHINGVRTLSDSLPPERQTLPRLMHDAGYTTAMIGKWHLKTEPATFDYYCVLPGQGTYFNPVFHDKDLGPWPDNQRHIIGRTFGHADAALWADDATTDLSLAWLERRDKSKPFFLMHHFKAPHGNWENPSRHDFLYDGIDIPEPESMWTIPHERSAATAGLGSSIGKRNKRRNIGMQMAVDQDLPPHQYQHVSYQRYLKRYLRCIRGVDDNVARLLDYLTRNGEIDNTIIIYTSDQGQLTGEHDYYDKRWMYEESLRMPFLVRLPHARYSGTTCDAMISNIDFAPTLLDLAGVATPGSMQGRSFKPMLEGKPVPADWPQAIYNRYWMHMAHHEVPAHYGIRTKDYKLIFFYGLPLDANGALPGPTTPGWELYDLRKDPGELKNVYNDPAYREIAADLKKQLLALKKQYGDNDETYPELMQVRSRAW